MNVMRRKVSIMIKKVFSDLSVCPSPRVFVCPDAESLKLSTLSIVTGPAAHSQLRSQ